jgi:hypothetical protein
VSLLLRDKKKKKRKKEKPFFNVYYAMPKLLMPNFDKNKTEKHIQKKEAKLNQN